MLCCIRIIGRPSPIPFLRRRYNSEYVLVDIVQLNVALRLLLAQVALIVLLRTVELAQQLMFVMVFAGLRHKYFP